MTPADAKAQRTPPGLSPQGAETRCRNPRPPFVPYTPSPPAGRSDTAVPAPSPPVPPGRQSGRFSRPAAGQTPNSPQAGKHFQLHIVQMPELLPPFAGKLSGQLPVNRRRFHRFQLHRPEIPPGRLRLPQHPLPYLLLHIPVHNTAPQKITWLCSQYSAPEKKKCQKRLANPKKACYFIVRPDGTGVQLLVCTATGRGFPGPFHYI